MGQLTFNPMKNIWLVANWKSNKTLQEALAWVAEVGPKLHLRDNFKVVVCPQFDALEEVKKAVQVGGHPIIVGAQDLSPFPPGAYTGEESAQALSQFVTVCILGHSERRQSFGETDSQVAEKVGQALKNKILPLVCVQGEGTPVPEGCRLVAYEPVFAIGTGKPDTPQDAEKVAVLLKQRYGDDLEVLYGGSVDAGNARAFLKQQHINGLLVGHTSLSAGEFLDIVNACLDPSI